MTRNLSDFALFLSVMKNREAFENMLSIILDEESLELLEVRVEHIFLNEEGKRAIRLDAWAMDSRRRQFNAEMQNDTEHDDMRKRARFYQAMMDAPILKSGRDTKYRQLPETIIVFITQDDIFGKDRAIYTFEEQCSEVDGLPLGDGTKKIFLNMSSRQGRKELVSLLQYMKDSRLDNPEISVLDRRIRRLDEIVTEVKQSEEWEAVEMSIYSEGIALGRKEGLEEGRKEGRAESLADGILSFLSDLGDVPACVKEQIQAQTDLELLHSWLKVSAKALSVSAKYSCGFPDSQVSPIIVVDRYLDYFTTIMEDRLWQVLAKPVFRCRNSSDLSMNAARAA